jgi:Ca-activated chloride channel family protein
MFSRRQVLALAGALPVRAQEPPSPTIRVDVRLIRVLANVKNEAGGLVGGLDKEDFFVKDNGVPQDISVFERSTQQPLRVAVLLDVSASVIKELKYETEATLKFARTLIGEGNEEDSIALITFNHAVDLVAGFTRRLKRLENALRDLRPGAGTSLYDAIYLASEELEGRDGRKVIILVTDGGDTASFKKFPEALLSAQRAQAAIYPILVTPVLNDPGRNVGGENALQLMAERTGGRVLLPGSFERLTESFTEILRDLRTQYLLGYYPRGVDGAKEKFHRLDVSVRRPSLRVYARTGYYEDTF